MPLDWDNGTDDPLVYDGTELFAGAASFPKSSRLAPDECAGLRNVDVTTQGLLVTRDPFHQLGAASDFDQALPIRGLGYFDIPGDERLFRVRGRRLWFTRGAEVNSSELFPWVDTGFDLFSSTGPVEFAQLGDVFYFVDGQKLYRWISETLEVVAAAPQLTWIFTHAGRLFGCRVGTDLLYESDVLDGTVWQASTRNLRVGSGDGDPITAAMPWYGPRILCAKECSLWVVDTAAASMSEYTIERVPGDIGCVAPRSLAAVGNDIYFLGRGGVYSVRRMIAQADQEVTLPISHPIEDQIRQINTGAALPACAVFWGNRYLLAVPCGSEASPHRTLCYNTQTQRWSGYWDNQYPTCWAKVRFSGRQVLVLGDHVGRCWWQQAQAPAAFDTYPLRVPAAGPVALEVGRWYDGDVIIPAFREYYLDAPPGGLIGLDPDLDPRYLIRQRPDFTTEVISRAYTCSDPLSEKVGDFLEIEFRRSQAVVDVYIARDAGGWALLDADVFETATTTRPPMFPLDPGQALPLAISSEDRNYRRRWSLLSFGSWRELQVKIVGKGDRLGVREIYLGAYLDAQRGELK